jgi:hypothetical protein
MALNISNILTSAAAAVLVFTAGQALANPSNVDEPIGNVILDLDGAAISHSWTTVTTSFIATATTTDIGFAFRDDPAFIFFDNASVTTGASSNLLSNGGFETGDFTGWSYTNPNNAPFPGVVTTGGHPGFTWFDGSVQAYDTLDQVIFTSIGSTYHVSFDYVENSSSTTFSRLSTDGDTADTGGNGLNIVVYAGNAAPVLQGGVPEPASWSLMILGFGGLGALLRHRRSQVALAA